MGRSQRLFKKRKNVGKPKTGNLGLPSNSTPLTTPSTSRPSSSPCFSSISSKTSSTSKEKLSRHSTEYNKFENDSFKNDIINLDVIDDLIAEVAVCKQCSGPLKMTASNRIGLAYTLNLECTQCNMKASRENSSKGTVENSNRSYYDINLRYVYALRAIGVGQESGRTFAGILNLNQPSKFNFYNKILLSATKKVCTASMIEAVEVAVKQNDGCRDIAAAFDGSWQRRGFSSLNGLVTATSITTGQVLDVAIFSKYCTCKTRFENVHTTSCTANYAGTSGGMEVAGVREIFRRSEDNYGIRYKYYLGDGDCKGYDIICSEKPYGDAFEVEKLECVGHVQKRMGTRLRTFKKKNSDKELTDGKTIGGRGRLSMPTISSIQLYYGLAIRRNSGKSVKEMETAIWATYFHLGSTDKEPQHNLCPKDDNTWCKYQKSKQDGTVYRHKEHAHLPKAIMQEIKPVFKDLTNPVLLAKCTHGGTQNVCESLNNIIWSRIPKKVFVRLETLKLGVYEAVSCYNKGSVAKCLVFHVLGLNPGRNCVAAMKLKDNIRVRKAEKALEEIAKKCRQANSLKRKVLEDIFEQAEDVDNPSYAPGHY